MSAPFEKFVISAPGPTWGTFLVEVSMPPNWTEICKQKYERREDWEDSAKQFIEDAIRKQLREAGGKQP